MMAGKRTRWRHVPHPPLEPGAPLRRLGPARPMSIGRAEAVCRNGILPRQDLQRGSAGAATASFTQERIMGKNGRRFKYQINEMRHFVAGIDLAGHADHYVCGPRKEDGTQEIARFGTTTKEIGRMIAWLKERRVESAAMESTSVYWIPVYDMLEKAGIGVVLVDPRTVKMVPGRKSDVKDCQWLQQLHSCGLLRGAFRPPEAFNAIRSVIRERGNVVQARTQAIQSIQKALDQMNIRLHHAVSDIDGKTGMRVLAAIVGGERDAMELAKLRDRRCKKSEEQIAEELTGTWREEHLFNLEQGYKRLCFLDGQLAECDGRIREMYAKLARTFPASGTSEGAPARKAGRKQKDAEDADGKADLVRICKGFDMTVIDGIGYATAAEILSELGPALDAFPTEKHFVSFLGLAPGLGKSAGKNVRTRKKHKNTSRAGQALKMAAGTLYRSQSELGGRFRCVRSRTCPQTAVRDVAREMAKRIYRGLKYGQAYVDAGEEAHAQRSRVRLVRSMRRKIAKLEITAEELGLLLPIAT